MARWNIGSYNRFIGARPEGVSVKEARMLYRSMAERLGRPVFRTDIKNHPRITKQEINKIKKTVPFPPSLKEALREKEIEEEEPLLEEETEEIELVGGFDSPGRKKK